MSSIKNNITGKKLTVKNVAKVAIVVSEYNPDICNTMYISCREYLMRAGISEQNITKVDVPGAWEIPFACQMMSQNKPDAIIAIGAIIKGETPHFDFIAKEVAGGIMSLSLQKNIPIIFGVLTTLNLNQAKARIKGGKRGDKGVEIAQAAIKMINLNMI